MVFGHSHDQAGILIEPKADYAIDIGDEDQLAKFRNLLWWVSIHFNVCITIEGIHL